jgi:hypothetical protein
MARTAVYRLTPEERAAAKEEMRSVLIDCARMRKTVTYTDVCLMIQTVQMHPHSFIFTRILSEVCAEEEERGHGVLCALVVSKTTGIPGAGYFRGMAELGHDMSDLEASWRAELEQVFDYWSNH